MARQLDDATAEREVSKYRRRSIDGNSRLSVKEVKMTGNLIAFPWSVFVGTESGIGVGTLWLHADPARP